MGRTGRQRQERQMSRSSPLRLNRIRLCAIYHRTGDCHATPDSLLARRG